MLSTIICYLPTLENNMIFDVTIFIKDFISFFYCFGNGNCKQKVHGPHQSWGGGGT